MAKKLGIVLALMFVMMFGTLVFAQNTNSNMSNGNMGGNMSNTGGGGRRRHRRRRHHRRRRRHGRRGSKKGGNTNATTGNTNR